MVYTFAIQSVPSMSFIQGATLRTVIPPGTGQSCLWTGNIAIEAGRPDQEIVVCFINATMYTGEDLLAVISSSDIMNYDQLSLL